MKKTVFLLFAVLLFSCGVQEPPSFAYVDGRYFGTYNAFNGLGWKPRMEILIRNNNIAEIHFDYISESGQLLSNNRTYSRAMERNVGLSPQEVYSRLEGFAVENQNWHINTVSGATRTSSVFQELLQAILKRARIGAVRRTILQMDSTYSASAREPDPWGWYGRIIIVIQDSIIVSVRYDEVNQEGDLKRTDKEFSRDMFEATGLIPETVCSRLEHELERLQTPSTIDAVSGATVTSQRFVQLAEEALSIR
ncbi:MAG: FMN-binding protein [Spirochaetia bacterium]